MYEATKKERQELSNRYGFVEETMDVLEEWSDKVRKGSFISHYKVLIVIDYQEALKRVRKSLKRWWEFWK